MMDLSTPQAQIAEHFMRYKGYHKKPHAIEKLEGQPCWYFYYALPEGELELEVYYDEVVDDWEVTVTAFPVAI